MASPITDPKDFAHHINQKMLAKFLSIQNPSITFEIKEDKNTKSKKRVGEDTVERFIKVIENLEDTAKARWLFGEMLYINELSEQRHITNLENQATEDGIIFGISDDYGECVCHDERALWWYMNHKGVFDKYFERADTENLSGLKELIIKDEYIVEKEKIADDSKIVPFGEEVAKIYANVLRGKKFRVVRFIEKDCVLVRVYLQNLPENQLVFTDEKEKQSTIGRTTGSRSLFNILFVYNPEEKTLGIRTNNPKENVPKLADIFCKSFLNCTYADTTERKYNVENRGSIRKLELTPEPMDSIERCYLKAVDYMKIGDYAKTLRLDIGGKQHYTGTQGMEEMIDTTFKKEDDQSNNGGTKESEWTPKKFDIKFIFRKMDETKGRKRQITASITKRGLAIKNTPEDQKIRQFLKAKGFIS
jgi:hypothetical protein